MDGVVGYRAKTKLPKKSKSIVTVKNFGGKGTTTVFMRDAHGSTGERPTDRLISFMLTE